jgi:cysteine desulfurase
MKRVYLDNNATTCIDSQVLRVLIEASEETFGNPSSVHWYGQEASQRLDSARRSIARTLGVRSSEIIFTSGGTEALHLVVKGVLGLQLSGKIITSDVEHAVVEALIQQQSNAGCNVVRLPAGKYGAVGVNAVVNELSNDVQMILLLAVNNETGVMTDIPAIAAEAQQRGIPLVIDGVASFGKGISQIPDGVAAMTFSGHKFHAPKGLGFAFVRRGIKLQPQAIGGAQEAGRRAGTESLPGIIALAEAVRLADEAAHGMNSAVARMTRLRDYFEASVIERCGDVMINGEGPRICNTTNLMFSGVDGESLLMSLDLEGVAASHGSACSAGALEPSRVLLSMGYSPEHTKQSIRFSLSRFTTEEEIEHAIKVVSTVVERLRCYAKVHRELSF